MRLRGRGGSRLSKPVDVRRIACLGRSPSTVADRQEQLAVLADRVLEPGDPVEREEPDAKREDVVLVQRLREERVVRAAVDVAVDPLVEVDERPLVGLVARRARALRGGGRAPRGRLRRALGGEPRGPRLERAAGPPRALRGPARRRSRRTCRAAGTPRRAARAQARAAPRARASVRARAAPSARAR